MLEGNEAASEILGNTVSNWVFIKKIKQSNLTVYSGNLLNFGISSIRISNALSVYPLSGQNTLIQKKKVSKAEETLNIREIENNSENKTF